MARVVVLGSFADSLIGFRGPLLAEMVRRGHTVFGCAPDASLAVRDALHDMGVRYVDVPLNRTGLNPIEDLGALVGLVRELAALKPDLILAYTIKPVIYGTLAAFVAAIPRRFSLITGLGYAFTGDRPKQRLVATVARMLYKMSLALNERVFFQNPDDLALFQELGLVRARGHAMVVHGSGVDTDHYAPAPLPADISFLLIARLLSDKGIREYVEAARILKERHPQLSFRLVGWLDDNPHAIGAAELEGWIATGVVEYLGRLKDVRPAITQCAVYVLPSYREGTPRTVLEAMALGRPIVTTDAPGCRETVIDGQNGFLVPVKDAAALAEAMERFVVQPELIAKMGERSRELAVQKYDVHKVNAVMLDEMGL